MTILLGPPAGVNATYMCKNLLKIGSIRLRSAVSVVESLGE